eukprot:TRINITY_DN732_c0_g1_i3.p1 TRINITY_DN732_c0_g1~~TRINITY_DN732_c0_g1_i3.p1  ORF type:complete len:291 (-),score=81.73 TRINITY_DN732_c0_g1_i3:61-933(-)
MSLKAILLALLLVVACVYGQTTRAGTTESAATGATTARPPQQGTTTARPSSTTGTGSVGTTTSTIPTTTSSTTGCSGGSCEYGYNATIGSGCNGGKNGTCPCPDIFLDVPNVSVDLISLVVEDLQVQLNLDARVGQLVQITAGVSASIRKVNLTIENVRAQAQLKVGLDNVVAIVSRALDTLDKNPRLLTDLVNAVGNALSETLDSVGNLVSKTLSSTGDLIERTTDSLGNVLSAVNLGNVLEQGFPIISSFVNTIGQQVKQLNVNGKIVQVVLDEAGKVIDAKQLQQAN